MEFYKIVLNHPDYPYYVILKERKIYGFDESMRRVDLTNKRGKVFDTSFHSRENFLTRYSLMTDDSEMAKLMLVFDK
jgi:hypothetical protein